MKYKVGDRLKLVQRGNSTLNHIGSVIELTEVCCNSVKSRKISGHLGDCYTNWTTDYLDENFELVEPQGKPYTIKGKPYTIKGKTYYAFPAGKTIKELGIDTSRKFIVVYGCGAMFKEGEILTLNLDDDTEAPYFNGEYGGKYCSILSRLAYYDEEETKEDACRECLEMLSKELTWGLGKKELQESLQIKANNLKPTGNKFMSNIVKFAKDAALAVSNPDEKLRREVGLKDESGNWTIEAKEIVMNLEAQALGFKGIEDFCNAMGVTTGSVFSTAFEAYNLLVKYDTQLLDIAKAKKAEDKK